MYHTPVAKAGDFGAVAGVFKGDDPSCRGHGAGQGEQREIKEDEGGAQRGNRAHGDCNRMLSRRAKYMQKAQAWPHLVVARAAFRHIARRVNDLCGWMEQSTAACTWQHSSNVPRYWWIMLVGASGVVAGLATYGRQGCAADTCALGSLLCWALAL